MDTAKKHSVTTSSQFFSRGGEMGALMRAYNWESSSLGAVAAWPQSLRAILGVILNSKLPMSLFWGKDLIYFYNDAFRQSLGKEGKHPAILGIKGEEAWPEIWHTIKPLIDQVFTDGEAAWTEDELIPIYRNGQMEDAYWTLSYSPAYGDSDEINGVFVACSETTNSVVLRKKSAESEAKFRNFILQAPIAISVIMGLHFSLEIVNKKQLVLWQKEEADILHKPLFDVFPEVKSQEFESLLTEVYVTGIPFTGQEIVAQLFRNGTLETAYFDFTYEPMRNEIGEVEGIIVTSYEVTQYVNARKLIEASEAFNRTILESSPDCLKVLDSEGSMQYINLNGLCQMEIDDFLTVKNKNWFTFWGSENEALVKASVDKALTGEPSRFIAFCPTAKSTPKWWDVVVSPVVKPGEPVQQIISVSRDITEQKESELKLKISEEKYHSLFESIDQGLSVIEIIFDETNKAIDYRFIENNTVFHQQTGLPDVKNKTAREVIPSLDDFWFETYGQVALTGKPIRFTHKADALSSWFDVYAFRLGKQESNKVAILFANITDRKKTEQQLAASEKRFRSLSQNSPDVISLHDKDFRYLYASPNIETLTGVKAEKFIGKTYREIGIPKELCVFFDEQLSIAFQKRSLHTIEFQGQNGIYFYSRLVPEYDEKGEPLSLLIINTDITERKKAEEKIKESENQFRIFADSIQILAWIANDEGWISWYNQQWYDYTGTTLEEMKGWGWQKVHHPDHVEKIIALTKDLWKKDEAFELTFPLRRHDGEYRWFLTRAYPVKDTNGNIDRWIGTNTDITEQKNFSEELEKKVNERTEELSFKTRQLEGINQSLELKNVDLDKMNRDLESFAYISSHDLQEPLRKIQTFASRITEKEKDNLSENGKHLFKRMQASAERMQSLIDDLLAYSRTNTSERVFEKINLHAFIEHITRELQEEIEQKNAVIDKYTPCEVHVIPFQFHQLFYNLISNSLKFSNPEHPLRITINSEQGKGSALKTHDLHRDTNYCHITVADNGIGFEPQYNEKIFGLFQRLHGRTEYEGTGIGLAIVKKIIENHHGLITAKGTLGKGATFDIYLPDESK